VVHLKMPLSSKLLRRFFVLLQISGKPLFYRRESTMMGQMHCNQPGQMTSYVKQYQYLCLDYLRTW